MQNTYNIFINYEDKTLEMIKTPSRVPVNVVTGKYGIEFHQDINNHTVKIVIPEPEILFGVSIENIQSFLLIDK